ncbi:hypothetical protein DMN91_006403 [Ooceraea biroi]|uniref:non-specific serine/threonine protein kinase n=1 Tax=Ooceraea biroi TaxID=2015173 RepID=A0A3L8DNL7_OOCBI|nr:eukaryotic translation initiation factor 2-alpha kinase 1 isoform X1 [Ooceraea biroi]RLU22024.1 hypothetical protein DMN91_006403 [Ooceraea biroi]
MKPVQTKKEFESIDNNNVAGDTSRTNDPWNTLTTVTTFDQGRSRGSTICLSANGNQTTGQITRTSSTLLIQSLLRQLCTMLETNKTRRQNLYTVICNELCQMKLLDGSYNVAEFETLRRQYHHAFSRLVSIARVMTGNESIPKSFLTPGWSRYQEEFNEISLIASGGFGEVYEALHRLDDTKYAIKKIVLYSSRTKDIDQYLNEVKTLARLNHANIVSYKAAWIEPLLPSIIPTRVSTNRESARVSSITSGPSNDSNCNDSSDNETSNADQSTDKSAPQEYTKDNTESSDIVSFRNSESGENVDKSEDTESKSEHTDIPTHESTSYQMCTYSNRVSNNGNQKYMMLYIQMTLCEQTLREWMRERISQTPQPIISAVLQQILCGVNYIHGKKIVHHDIKPSNIFISRSGQLQVQLGDFGLACPLQRGTRHSVLGTFMYAAPEQLEGKCDAKSDIYSIGIVLTELLILTHTQMELTTVINCLKCGMIPETVTMERHKWARMIVRMVQDNPDERPCTTELLQDLEKDNDTKIVSELKQTVQALTHNIRDKDEQIQELQDQIASLKEQVRKKES